MNAIYEDAKKRIPSTEEMIFKILKEAGSAGVLNHTIQKVTPRYQARIQSLRKEDGHDIRVENLGNGEVKYYLIKEADSFSQQNVVKAVDILLSQVDDTITSEQLLALIQQNDLVLMRRGKQYA